MGTFFRDTLDNQAQSQDHIKHKTFFVGKKQNLQFLKLIRQPFTHIIMQI